MSPHIKKLKTTVVGAYPPPEWVTGLGYWFVDGYETDDFVPLSSDDRQKALKEVIESQVNLGLDVITDGELGRENYIFHFARQLNGYDFEKLEWHTHRNGACHKRYPVIRSKISPRSISIGNEWKEAQALTDVTVKYTIPGPMTLTDTFKNSFYASEEKVGDDLVACVQAGIDQLCAAGCKVIQIDEPVLVRYPEKALKYGIVNLTRCFQNVPPDVTKVVHLCCGYPWKLDQEDFSKADSNCYKQIAPALDEAGFDQISIEDSHRRNDLSLFDMFKKTSIILGSIKIASTHCFTPEEIQDRIMAVSRHIPLERLTIAPDCGLRLLTRQLLQTKISNMVEAVRRINKDLEDKII